MVTSARSSVPPQAHICALVDVLDDLPGLAAASAQDGLLQDEQVIVIGGTATLGEVRETVQQAAEREAAGELRLVTWTRMYSHAHAGFDPAAALQSLQALAAEGCAHRQCHGVRMISQMEWVLNAAGGNPRRISAYERGLDRFVNGAAEVYSMCLYPVRGLSGELLLDLLAAHPMAMARGQLVESPFYVMEAAP